MKADCCCINLLNSAIDETVLILNNAVLKGTKNCTLAFGKYWIKNKENL